MPGNESPIFARAYDLLRWLIPLTLKYPRQQRFVLAAALQQSAFRLHERLIEAAHSKHQRLPETLQHADVELDKLRHYLRLSHDLLLLSDGQYEHAAACLAEIGKLLGARHKAASRRGPPVSGGHGEAEGEKS